MSHSRVPSDLKAEVRAHKVKLSLLASSAVVLSLGVYANDSTALLVGVIGTAMGIGQFISYWGTATTPAKVGGGTPKEVLGDVIQVLDHEERKNYTTGRRLDELAGDDTVVVLAVGEQPDRLDRLLPWRETRPRSEYAPVVVVGDEYAPNEGETVNWVLQPTTLEGVYVRRYWGSPEDS
ncbi:hypothetical protein C437_15441 [Haloarcula vallismortis ATCC 29715]|uniref:Uncharacterized protein n=1 Tax=Haloarcula vallismortis ATCC 29715 TaxID=662477 RepID=M0IYL5_HALVA|nr:hypothetical protein [Haloarcula vallismortis]EMA01826.1 hypothetical protein C437_15441 [Haloarcula vallismortis ATCC 29715]